MRRKTLFTLVMITILFSTIILTSTVSADVWDVIKEAICWSCRGKTRIRTGHGSYTYSIAKVTGKVGYMVACLAFACSEHEGTVYYEPAYFAGADMDYGINFWGTKAWTRVKAYSIYGLDSKAYASVTP